MTRIIALAHDSIFFTWLFAIHRIRIGNFKSGRSRSLSGNLFAPADSTGKIFRIPIGLPDTAHASLSMTTHIDRHGGR
ncbi:hypothetical protein [Burkholderia sp. SIMBA_062]|uniref:hypothetical protein n=1 Tax=Burkholderia sp. SIMBA_062 TaxID=3085803 RepID=UPI003979E47C